LIDLHCHTNASDGEKTPEQLVAKAIKRGLSAMAITDHDTTAGIPRAIAAAEGTGLEVVPGVEFSSYLRDREIHILGFFIPYEEPFIVEYISNLNKQREIRGRKMIDNLNAIGYDLTYDEASALADGAPIMSPHITRALWQKGILTSFDQAVEFYRDHMVHGGDVYVEHSTPIEDVYGILNRAKCPIAIAHPHKIGDDAVVADLIKMGCHGLEGYYPDMEQSVAEHYRDWAQREGLFVCGGSDYHGMYSPRKLGSANVPDEVLDEIKGVRDRLRG